MELFSEKPRVEAKELDTGLQQGKAEAASDQIIALEKKMLPEIVASSQE